MNRKGVRTEKLRIAMFGHKRIPSREGGIEVVVEELSTRLVAKGCSVTCYNRSGHNVAGAEYDRADSDEFRGVKLKKVFTIDHRGFAALTASVTASIRAALGYSCGRAGVHVLAAAAVWKTCGCDDPWAGSPTGEMGKAGFPVYHDG